MKVNVWCGVCLFVSVVDSEEGTDWKEIESVLFWGILRMWVIVAAGGWESCSIYFVREDRLSHALLLQQRDRDGESYDCLKLTNSILEKGRGWRRKQECGLQKLHQMSKVTTQNHRIWETWKVLPPPHSWRVCVYSILNIWDFDACTKTNFKIAKTLHFSKIRFI